MAQTTISDPRNQAQFSPAANNAYSIPNNWPPNTGQRVPSMAEQMGCDPTSKLAAAITDHAAAIRELADVLYHINTED